MSSDQILGYCGLYCPGCGVYQATATGKGVEYEPGSFTTCRGCNSGELSVWCQGCETQSCARERGLRYCLECGEYPCEKAVRFRDDPRFPYHADTPAMMVRLSAIGLEAWVKEQDERWNCRSCGSRFDWFSERCPGCGAAVNQH